jgi:hypothetical protein
VRRGNIKLISNSVTQEKPMLELANEGKIVLKSRGPVCVLLTTKAFVENYHVSGTRGEQ